MAEQTPAAPATGDGAPPETPAQAPEAASPLLASVLTTDELRTAKSLERYQTPDALASAYLELEGKLGDRTQGLTPPGLEATDDERQAFYRALPGYPEEASGYEIQAPELPPEAGEMQPEFVQSFLDGAHTQGLTNAQVAYVFDFYAQFIGQQVQGQRDADATGVHDAYEALRQQWTVQTDQRLMVADEYLRRTLGEEHPLYQATIQRQDGKAVPLRNMPEFIQMAEELGRLHGHDKFVIGDGRGGMLGVADASERLDAAYAQHSRGEIDAKQLEAEIQRYQPIISAGER